MTLGLKGLVVSGTFLLIGERILERACGRIRSQMTAGAWKGPESETEDY